MQMEQSIIRNLISLVRGKNRVITGMMDDEQLKRISDLTTQNPEFQEILHGPSGYKSPYRTIEQIAQDRKSGVIAPTSEGNYRGLFEEIIEDNQPKVTGDVSPKVIGDVSPTMLRNTISRLTSGAKSDIADARFAKAAGLEGVTDPYEQAYSALSKYIEKYGMDEESTRQFEALERAASDKDAPVHVKRAHEAYKHGKEMHEAGRVSSSTEIPSPEKESKPKAVIETTKDGRPVIKVGTPVKAVEEPTAKETKKTPLKVGKKVEKTSEKTEEVAQLPSMGGVLDDALDVATSPKEVSEALAEKVQEKMDPSKKIEEKVEKEKEKAQEKLVDNIIEADNARFRSAAGRAPVDTAFKKKLVEGISSVTGRAPGRTTMEILNAGEGLAQSVITAAKSGKNLRLAGTAALLSVAGFAISKGRDKIGNQPDGPMGPDETSNLRRSLMSDG